MVGAVLGVAGNQVVARYKARVGRRIQSATFQADARHSWLDALSSLGALIGLAVVALGFIALGLHSLALARWARLLGSS